MDLSHWVLGHNLALNLNTPSDLISSIMTFLLM
jgi:hypothetical protein